MSYWIHGIFLSSSFVNSMKILSVLDKMTEDRKIDLKGYWNWLKLSNLLFDRKQSIFIGLAPFRPHFNCFELGPLKLVPTSSPLIKHVCSIDSNFVPNQKPLSINWFQFHPHFNQLSILTTSDIVSLIYLVGYIAWRMREWLLILCMNKNGEMIDIHLLLTVTITTNNRIEICYIYFHWTARKSIELQRFSIYFETWTKNGGGMVMSIPSLLKYAFSVLR
jgi:hypothetical protein